MTATVHTLASGNFVFGDGRSRSAAGARLTSIEPRAAASRSCLVRLSAPLLPSPRRSAAGLSTDGTRHPPRVARLYRATGPLERSARSRPPSPRCARTQAVGLRSHRSGCGSSSSAGAQNGSPRADCCSAGRWANAKQRGGAVPQKVAGTSHPSHLLTAANRLTGNSSVPHPNGS
jgi:hypothetical protein